MDIFHGKLMCMTPWAAHGIAWGIPGWVDAMDIFHGKLMCRSPWAAHGIAWGDSWVGGCHGYLPWQAHVQVTMGSPWNCMGDSWVGGCHGYLPWQAHVQDTMGSPW